MLARRHPSAIRTTGLTTDDRTQQHGTEASEQVDRDNKWEHDSRIPSLQEHVLASQSHPRAERHRRLASGG